MNYLKAVTGTAIGTLMGTSKVIGTVTLWERKRYGNGNGMGMEAVRNGKVGNGT